MLSQPSIVLGIVLLIAASPLDAQRIPEHLVQCYRTHQHNATTNGTARTAPAMPFTLQLFVELLRKIEDANPTSLDMRLVSLNLMHRLRLDGVERAPGVRETAHVTPFRANGIQVTKYQLLLQLISDSATRLDFEAMLTPAELCQLHRMLSASVEPWERGDEQHVCPKSRDSGQRVHRPWLKINQWQVPASAATTATADRLSRCPLEGGVVRSTEYGSFAVGTVVASLAAGLQPQRVSISTFFKASPETENVIDATLDGVEGMDENAFDRLVSSLDMMDNMYAAGLAGDLAEVCVYQGPYVGENVTLGLEGVWNNTVYPRSRHFPDASAGRWELTDAEILAGIDGIFLTQQIAGWQRKVRRLRLSQVIDMYYSARGIPVVGIQLLPAAAAGGGATRASSSYLTKRFSTRDDLTSACDRRTVLQLIDWETLKLETFHLAQVLQYRRSSMSVNDATLQLNCEAAVDRLAGAAERLLQALPTCSRVNEYATRPAIDLTLVLDGSRTEYESLELISYVVESIDVSNSGSWISIIHGQTGEYMVRRTRSVASVFEQLQNFTGAFPTGLSIPRALQRVHTTLVNQTRHERQAAILAAEAHVLLIVSQKQRITELDFASAYSMMHGSMLHFPDLYFVFVTNAGDQIRELLRDRGDGAAPSSAAGRRPEHYKVHETNSLEATTFGASLGAHLNTIPKRIVTPFCRNDSRTEYTDRDRGDGFVFFEDYISPNQEHAYRIGPELIARADEVRVQFHVNYGKLTVCMAREWSRTTLKCHSIGETNAATFELGAPCAVGGSSDGGICRAVYFFVTLDQSHMRCTENRCRYPDQVLMIMRHSGLRCERDDRSGASARFLSGVLVVFVAILMTSRLV